MRSKSAWCGWAIATVPAMGLKVDIMGSNSPTSLGYR
jgi:hypothetical protein